MCDTVFVLDVKKEEMRGAMCAARRCEILFHKHPFVTG